MKDSQTTDIIAFLLCVFLLFAIIVATQVHPLPPDVGYEVIQTREDGTPMYIRDVKTGATYYVNKSGGKIDVVCFD